MESSRSEHVAVQVRPSSRIFSVYLLRNVYIFQYTNVYSINIWIVYA